jgi:hypothetical protein
MFGRLSVMAGNNSGAVWMDPAGKSDFDAGLLFFGAVARMNPGLTWAELQQPQFMAGWLTDAYKGIKRGLGDVKDGVGDVLKDTFTTTASAGGDLVRLAADPAVADTVSRAATAYATGGASEGATSLFDSLRNIFTPAGQQAVSNAGAAYKAGGINLGNPWIIGGGLGLGALLLIMVAKK